MTLIALPLIGSHSFSLQLPEEARELEKELRQITKEKNEAVRSQDFEKVCYYFKLSLGCCIPLKLKHNIWLLPSSLR